MRTTDRKPVIAGRTYWVVQTNSEYYLKTANVNVGDRALVIEKVRKTRSKYDYDFKGLESGNDYHWYPQYTNMFLYQDKNLAKAKCERIIERWSRENEQLFVAAKNQIRATKAKITKSFK